MDGSSNGVAEALVEFETQRVRIAKYLLGTLLSITQVQVAEMPLIARACMILHITI